MDWHHHFDGFEMNPLYLLVGFLAWMALVPEMGYFGASAFGLFLLAGFYYLRNLTKKNPKKEFTASQPTLERKKRVFYNPATWSAVEWFLVIASFVILVAVNIPRMRFLRF